MSNTMTILNDRLVELKKDLEKDITRRKNYCRELQKLDITIESKASEIEELQTSISLLEQLQEKMDKEFTQIEKSEKKNASKSKKTKR